MLSHISEYNVVALYVCVMLFYLYIIGQSVVIGTKYIYTLSVRFLLVILCFKIVSCQVRNELCNTHKNCTLNTIM